MGLIVGIDATNLRGGGGVTHLVELLNAVELASHGIRKIVIWGGEQTLKKLPSRSWLEKISPEALNQGLVKRTFWQRLALSSAVRNALCDVLFVPGGSYSGDFEPIVTMSRNLLPFEWRELRRYGMRPMCLKLLILRYTQSRSYRSADGVIFLTEYAKNAVLKVTGPVSGQKAVIPHGVSTRFQSAPKEQKPIRDYSQMNPFRLLYVSTIDQYKHQWHLIEAVHTLRAQGFQLTLDLIGPAYSVSLTRLRAAIVEFDPDKVWVRYHGAVPHEALNGFYAQADLGVFASSCENLPNILLETMAAALPVACSNRGPMPEVLGDAGLYFDPENPVEIAQTLRKYLDSSALRSQKSKASFKRSQQYTWERCANDTFAFLSKMGLGKIKG
ncbi:MAG: hypothetical protein CMM15_11505 [Rhodospirillaceae bacterium]|nr:hypothetical protein [Rhodospirillaceae bacterium]